MAPVTAISTVAGYIADGALAKAALWQVHFTCGTGDKKRMNMREVRRTRQFLEMRSSKPR